MDKHYQFYESLLDETRPPDRSISLWDLIVITAIGTAQKECYEKQIETKLHRRQLPKSFNYLVLSDPDNIKIGSGGSTMHVCHELYSKYGDSLFSMKILLIHAGGYSQRMPTCSVLGKIFSPVACRSSCIRDILDLKLAIYTPFSFHMSSGVFLTSSDDFQTYDFDEQVAAGASVFQHTDFVLISHESSLQIAKDHGVYVLEKPRNQVSNCFDCKFVLQKPSIEKMRQLDIVLSKNDKEYVHTDSVFYFSHDITRALLRFHDEHFESVISNQIEIDAYRDFLQPLGTQPLTLGEFLSSVKKDYLTEAEKDLLGKVYQAFLGRRAKILALTDSDFFHLGTISELFDSYLNQTKPESAKFRQSLGFTQFKSITHSSNSEQAGLIMYSSLGSSCHLDPTSIAEYCYIDPKVRLNISQYCYLSNCELTASQDQVNIPANVCLHTVPIRTDPDSIKYITVTFHRLDDLKKEYPSLSKVKYFTSECFSEQDSSSICLTHSNKGYSIWNLKLFKAYDSMSESFLQSVHLATLILSSETARNELLTQYFKSDVQFYSMFDMLALNEYQDMLSYRIKRNLV